MSVDLICAVHGFLGQSSDWNNVKNLLPQYAWHTPDLFSPMKEPDLRFSDIQKAAGKKLYVGYSLGGRIGLSILSQNPELFDHYIFVSVNPGFAESDLGSRELRIKNDIEWAHKISRENWNAFLKEWNLQSVFSSGRAEPERKIENFNLERLKDFLTRLSLGRQQDYTDIIKKNKNRITWVVGSEDQKFVTIAESLRSKNAIEGYVKIESGHRIPFDDPKNLSHIISVVAESL